MSWREIVDIAVDLVWMQLVQYMFNYKKKLVLGGLRFHQSFWNKESYKLKINEISLFFFLPERCKVRQILH